MLTVERNYVILHQIMVAEEITHLQKLQEYDLKILALKNRIDALPLGVAHLQGEAEEKKKEIEEKKKIIQNAELAQRKLELELREKEEQIKKFQLQLNETKTNKEYTIFLQEIEEAKKENSLRENKILEMMSEQDTLRRDEEKEQILLKEANEKFSEKKKEAAAEIETLKSQLKGEEDKRKLLAANITKTALFLYEKVRKSKKNGLVIAQIKDGTCSGCFMKVPSTVVENVKKEKYFVLCENCSRILYLETAQ